MIDPKYDDPDSVNRTMRGLETARLQHKKTRGEANCYGPFGPFKYRDVFSDPLEDAFVACFNRGFKLGMKYAIEKETEEQVRDQTPPTTKTSKSLIQI